ncbi:MAG: FlaG protein [Holophagaceae bacterium]|nr:FlaG protein [Holophagaceae bacterium]
MADQVNPLGGLAPGMAQTLQSSSVPNSPKTTPIRSDASKPKAVDGSAVGASKKSLSEAAKTVEDYLQSSSSDLKFFVDKDTGVYGFKIVDATTHETIRQVPAEEVIEMAKRLRSLSDTKDASGVLMDAEG